MSAYRRAGLGGFWCDAHPIIFSLPLEGPNQTNNRAELAAVIRAILIDSRPLEARSDSKYVVDNFRRLESIMNAPHITISNPDLWTQLWGLVRNCLGKVIVVKVKGHATWGDVESGDVCYLDKRGNALPDQLARQGADMHPAMPHIMTRAAERKKMVCTIQRVFLNILRERGEDLSAIRDALPPMPRRIGAFARCVRRRL